MFLSSPPLFSPCIPTTPPPPPRLFPLCPSLPPVFPIPHTSAKNRPYPYPLSGIAGLVLLLYGGGGKSQVGGCKRDMLRGIALRGSDVEMLALSVSGGGEGKVGYPRGGVLGGGRCRWDELAASVGGRGRRI